MRAKKFLFLVKFFKKVLASWLLKKLISKNFNMSYDKNKSLKLFWIPKLWNIMNFFSK